jgi:hypothetical protein
MAERAKRADEKDGEKVEESPDPDGQAVVTVESELIELGESGSRTEI